MSYFVTGGTGFIGRHLIEKLLQRRGTIYVLVRKDSKPKFKAMLDKLGTSTKRVVPVTGDLTRKNLGVGKAQRDKLSGKIRHFFHVAAIYDLAADAESQVAANVGGTENAVSLATSINAKCFHHVSSIAAAGLYRGTFREDMFSEAEKLDHPYFRTKHDSEAVVREHCGIPYRIYRPAIVVGHSQTGTIDKIDGPYYFFKLIQKMRRSLPSWMPTIGIEGSRINLVPVDYVVDAMDHIAHTPGLNGQCFHLVDPKPRRIGEVLNIFARAGHAPEMTMRLDARMFAFVPQAVKSALAMLAPLQRIINVVLADLGIPRDMLQFMNYPTRFDSREAERALRGTDIAVPDLRDYAWRLWDYWERNLDPDLFVDRSLRARVQDRVVVVTGASSGIGKAAALMLSDAGAKVMLVARKERKLKEAQDEIAARGGQSWLYSCDVSDMESCDRLIDQIVEDHGQVDILINNAGRSIRRSIALSFDRFHDFERTMQLNYFGSLRLIMRALPHMMERRTGHIINVSSIGVITNAPRFSAYVASKSALDSFSRCAASEFADQGINFTTINMPLVRTPMIAPTKIYQSVPTISPEEAAGFVQDAVIRRPQRIATRLGVFAQVLHALAPKLSETVMNSAFRLFPDSAAARGVRERQQQASAEQVAFASLMRGIHW